MRLYCVGGISELRTMAMTVLMVVIVFTSIALAMRVDMVMTRRRHEINDIAHTTLLQPWCKSLQRKTWVFEVMQSHADSHNIEFVEIRPRVLLRDTLSKQISVVRGHPIGEPKGLGIAVELVHHVVGDIEADDFGEEGRQGLPAVSQRAILFTLVETYH